ncbi:MAG TPA: hypothetical protein VMW45_04495 [Dehalococcoidia bacterium]|nr:hypothetical protein [Dehalococcoidia bacterium]
MEWMKASDDSMHADMTWHETGIGGIEIRTMAYHSGLVPDEGDRVFTRERDRVMFSREIVVRDWMNHPQATGYGEIIFEGTLEELIGKLKGVG